METPAPRDRSGFRLRGLEMTRIETFTDAAFAFALTLLVISLDPPSDYAGLARALRDVPAFLLSAGMLMMFWWGHHQWSRRYGLSDYTTFLLSCALVFTVLVYVYPLRFMFASMMSWLGHLSGAPLDGGVRLGEPADVNRLFIIYGIGFAAMAGTIALLYLHAWRARHDLGLDHVEQHETRAHLGAWAILGAAGLASVAVAATAPPSSIGLPGWVYSSLAIIMPLYGRAMNRRRPAAAAVPHLT